MISFMHVITRKGILEFAQKDPDCSVALESWYRIVKRTDFNSFIELQLKEIAKVWPDIQPVFSVPHNKIYNSQPSLFEDKNTKKEPEIFLR